jgi:hypothetical protein
MNKRAAEWLVRRQNANAFKLPPLDEAKAMALLQHAQAFSPARHSRCGWGEAGDQPAERRLRFGRLGRRPQARVVGQRGG